MSDQPESSPPAAAIRAATLFIVVLIVGIYVPAMIVFVPAASAFAVPAAYLLPGSLAMVAAISFRLMLLGTARIPPGPLIAGAFLVFAGAGFDIFATILHTPDLRHEANPIARLLLDSDHSTKFVLVYAGTCQGLLAAGSVLLWGGLLSHRNTIIESIRSYSPTFPRFLKAIFGGGKKTWGQFLVPWIRYPGNKREKYYYYPWPIAAILVGAGVYRAYLGLEWFGNSFLNRTAVGIGSMTIGLMAYLSWAWREVQWANRKAAIVETVPFVSGPDDAQRYMVPAVTDRVQPSPATE